MVRVTQSVDLRQTQLRSKVHHRAQGFRSVSASPGVLGKHVARRGDVFSLETQSRTSEQFIVALGLNQIWPSGPCHPLAVTEGQKRLGFRDRTMHRPAEESRDFGVTRVPSEDLRGIEHSRFSKA